MKDKSKLDELLDELIKDKTPEEIVSDSGILGALTKRLYERALEGEMTDHPDISSTTAKTSRVSP